MQLVFIIAAGTIPSLLFYFWLKNQRKDIASYGNVCRRSLIAGLLSGFPVALCCLVLEIISGLCGIKKLTPWMNDAFRSFIMFALVEEASKALLFSSVYKKADHTWSMYDIIASLTIVGLGFEILESVVASFTMNLGQGLVRGLTIMHGTFQFVMGLGFAKSLKNKNKSQGIFVFLIAWLWHGVYDFCLSDSLRDVHFLFDFLPVTLAFFSLVTVFVMISFFRKKKTDETYTEPLN